MGDLLTSEGCKLHPHNVPVSWLHLCRISILHLSPITFPQAPHVSLHPVLFLSLLGGSFQASFPVSLCCKPQHFSILTCWASGKMDLARQQGSNSEERFLLLYGWKKQKSHGFPKLSFLRELLVKFLLKVKIWGETRKRGGRLLSGFPRIHLSDWARHILELKVLA